MRIILEPEDLNAIANEVARKINPTLEKVLETLGKYKRHLTYLCQHFLRPIF